MKGHKVLIIGLDAAVPNLVFSRFRDELPNLSMMVEKGISGRLRSCHPPITIPAWIVMVTGMNPGRLGLYGFRHRKGNSYTEITLPSSQSVEEKRVWDYVGDCKGKSCLIAVPPTYPPHPVDGWLISCLMTPNTKGNYTYPSTLRTEIEKMVGEYIIDVPFRQENRRKVLKSIYEMTEKRITIIKHLLDTKPWDLFTFVEIGLDRIQHAFWKYFDEEHHLHEEGSEFEAVIRDYYSYLDQEVGELLCRVDDETTILVVSDHGAKRMKGAFSINHWLIEEGYLTLETHPKKVSRLETVKVNWNKTTAWAWGGYYARVFLNLKGREKEGTVNPEDFDNLRDDLTKALLKVRGPNGEFWKTKVFKPEELYPVCNGNPPDLLVYLDDLYWRSAGTIGHKTLYLPENDMGPDDAVHDYDGIFILYDQEERYKGEADLDIVDITPTTLKIMGIPIPKQLEGKSL